MWLWSQAQTVQLSPCYHFPIPLISKVRKQAWNYARRSKKTRGCVWQNDNKECAQSAVNILAAMSSSSQSTPANKFSPVTALQPIIHQWWLLIWSKASACGDKNRREESFLGQFLLVSLPEIWREPPQSIVTLSIYHVIHQFQQNIIRIWNLLTKELKSEVWGHTSHLSYRLFGQSSG